MKANILEHRQKEARVELDGEGHTFCSAIQNVLLKDESVEFAGYRIPHPLVSQPIFYIRTKGERDPIDALTDAAIKLKQELKEIGISFQEAWEDEKNQPHGRGKS